MDDASVSQQDGEIAPGVKRAPLPAWADDTPYDVPQTPDPNFVTQGVTVLLDDSQADLTGPARAWLVRRAELIVSSAGADRVANFEMTYDPSCVHNELHWIRVRRGDQTIDHSGGKFEVMRRERNLELGMFDGLITAHLVIPDVRVGDIVETAYTTFGMRPVLQDRHSCWVATEWPDGVLDIRHRLRRPKTREVWRKSFGDTPTPTVTEENDVVVEQWRAKPAPGRKLEALVPPWTMQCARLQFSEWPDWASVVGAYWPGYGEDGALPKEIEDEIARIDDALSQPDERATAVLRFVQENIRYIAVSIGDGGFVPRGIEDIWSTRYGDCKDAAKLYVLMAQRLKLDACPALVNTQYGEGLHEWLPTGFAFDHCIVRVQIGNQVHWLDPTMPPQPSRLEMLAQVHMGWSLPLKDSVTALERMKPSPLTVTIECEEKVVFGASPDDPVSYEWRTTYRSWRAESIRARIEREGEVALFRSYAEDVQRVWDGATPTRQAIEVDQSANNLLVTLERYDIAHAWKQGDGSVHTFTTYDITMRNRLAPLDGGARKLPIHLGGAERIQRHVSIEAPFDQDVTAWRREVESEALRWTTSFAKSSPGKFTLDQTLEITAQEIGPGDAPKYRNVVEELNKPDIEFAAMESGGKFVGALRTGQQANWKFWAWVAGAGVLVAIALRWLTMR